MRRPKIIPVQRGFTIVELLIVIVIIGILAALVIVSYTGISNQARISSLKSDLGGASTQLSIYNVNNGAFPPDLTTAALKSGSGTTYQYTYTAATNSYCITGTNNGVAYMITNTNTVPSLGACPGDAAPGVNQGIVTTLAGSGTLGSANGTGIAASFYDPCGVAVDGSGNVYVADTDNNLIRKITPAGVVTTLAGSGAAGSTNGTGTAASFNSPYGVAVDTSGNVYVAEYYGDLIRKITSGGVVTTLAGSVGSPGSTNGTGTAAKFNEPTGLAVDGSGNVYVADYGNNLVRKITSGGVVTTLAGSGSTGSANGTGTAASFNLPFDVAVDGSGNVYVGDTYNQLVRKITSGGVVTTLAGSVGSSGSTNGTGTAAKFYNPAGVAVDGSGNVYVADSRNYLIREITPAGVVTTLAGSGTAGSTNATGTAASFKSPLSVAVDSSGNLYVADEVNYLIRMIH